MKRHLLFLSICIWSVCGYAADVTPPPPIKHGPPSQNGMPVKPQPPIPPANPKAPPPVMDAQAPPPAANPDTDMPVFQNSEGYHYDPVGRRDPFKPYGQAQPQVFQPDNKATPDQPAPPPEPLQAFDVSQFKLLGIIWQVKDPKAMVLDPSGRTHLIRKQTRIGRNSGFVAAIREGEVIVVEPSVGENGVQTAVTRILNLK